MQGTRSQPATLLSIPTQLCTFHRDSALVTPVQIFREVHLHSSLSHDHVIKLYGAFQQADQVVLVQEYADAGDLFNLLQR